MSQQVPIIPVGKQPITTWLNKVSNAIPSNRLASSPDYVVKQTSHGTTLMDNRNDGNPIYVDDRGEFNATEQYAPGDLVTVYSGVVYTGSVGVVVSASVGTWICEWTVPDKTISDALSGSNLTGSVYARLIRKDGVNYAPIYPEPTSSAELTDGGLGRYWRRISGGGGSAAFPYVVKSVQAEVLTCRTYDGQHTGSTDVYIAKPFKLRETAPNSVTIDGNTITYSGWNWNLQARTASIGATSKLEVITPRYLVNDVIWAIETNTCVTGSVSAASGSIEYLDMNVDGRAWALKKGQ